MFHFTVINKPTMAAIMGEKLMFGASSPQEYSPNTTDEPDIEDPRVLKGIAVVECILMAFGVCGNVMLFILMQSKRMKKYSFSVYFSFAAIFDTLSIFWNCLQDIYDVANTNSLEEDVAAPYSFGCGILELFDGWFITTSAWLMVVLSFDRFMSICHPRRAERFCRRKVAFIICICVVLIFFVVGLPWPLIKGPSNANDNTDDPIMCGDEPESISLDFLDVFLVFLIPVACVTVLNIFILIKLREKVAFRDEASLTETGRAQNTINRLNVTIFYLLVMTVLTWLPQAIVSLIETVYFQLQGHDDNTSVRANIDYAWYVTLVLWLMTFVQNFYVLMLLSPAYRRELKLQCSCMPCISTAADSSDQNDIINNEQSNDDI